MNSSLELMETESSSLTQHKVEEKTLYLFRFDNRCISHDGYIQLGIHSHSLERHLELCPTINWVETYWCPDIFKNRYKRATFQAHERTSGGKDTMECRPRDFPYESACGTVQEGNRLERTV